MEFGISYNNNLLMPLLNAITENNLENMGRLSEIIYNTIFNFNSFLENYPEYKQYLLRHTEYNTGLQQTYLKVYEQHKLFTLVEYIDHMFIEHPPLFFFIKFYQLVILKCNIDMKMLRKPAMNDNTSASTTMVTDSFASHALVAMEDINQNLGNQDYKQLGDVERQLIQNVLQNGRSGFSANLCFVFSIYIGLNGENDSDSYDFLSSIICQSIQLGMRRVENCATHIMDFLNYLSKLIEITPFKKKGSRISDNAADLKMYTKILNLFNSKTFGRFKEKIVEICFQILSKLHPANRLPRPTLLKQHKSRKATSDMRMFPEIDAYKMEEKGSNKNILTKGAISVPGSPYKTDKSEDNSNMGYFQLNQLNFSSDTQQEKEIRSEVIAAILSNLSWIKVDYDRQETSRMANGTPFQYDIVEILEVLRSRFKDN